MPNDIEAKLERLKALKTGKKTKDKKETKKNRERKLFEEAATGKETKVAASVEETAIFKILTDTSLDSAEQVDQISETLFFDFTDPENDAQSQALGEVRALIAALIEDFTQQSSEAIELIRDNPLSELTANGRAVFENYNNLLNGREELLGKLAIIQGFMEENNGDLSKLMEALKNAQNATDEKDRLEKDRREAEENLGKANDEVAGLNTRSRQIDDRLSAIGNKSWWNRTFSTDLKLEEQRLTTERTEIETKKVEARRRHTKAVEGYEVADSAYDKFINANDFGTYEKILEILDIGNPEFKDMLSSIADNTLQYISDTKELMQGSRNQLAKSLEDVIRAFDLSVNTGEKIAILRDALTKAQDKNAQGYLDFQNSKGSEVPGLNLREYEEKRIEAKATAFTAEVGRSIDSTTQIDANMMIHRTTLSQAREDLDNGVASADSQLLKAVATSAMTGQTILQRTERLAAMSQKVIADTMYENDLREAFGGVVNDFEAQLKQRLQANNELDGYGDLVSQMSEALSAKNDTAIELAAQQSELVSKLNDSLKKLEEANETQAEIASVIAADNMQKREAGNDNATAPKASEVAPGLK